MTRPQNMSAKNKLVQHTLNCVQNHITTTYGSLKYTQVFMLCDFITQKAKSWLITFHKSFKSKLHKNLIKHCQFSIWFWKVLISPLWNLRRKWILQERGGFTLQTKDFKNSLLSKVWGCIHVLNNCKYWALTWKMCSLANVILNL